MRYNRKSVKVTSSVDSPAVSLIDMKKFLREDGSANDDIITAYIATATEAVKNYCHRAILTETFQFTMDGFADGDVDARLMAFGGGTHEAHYPSVLGSAGTIDIPFPVIQSVTSITTYDRDNTSSVFSSTKYGVDLETGRIYLNEGQTWPSELRAENAVAVVYVAGYGSGNIPADVLEAIRRYVRNMYDGCDGQDEQFKRLLAPYVRHDMLAWGV